MSVSLEYFQLCSAQTGYAIGPLEKVVRLGEIAADIARHPFLGKVLALKGGTALNLCLDLPRRLSVDLDFNYIGHLERDKMLTDRPRVEEALVQLADRKAYRIQKSADAFAGRKFYERPRRRQAHGLTPRNFVETGQCSQPFGAGRNKIKAALF